MQPRIDKFCGHVGDRRIVEEIQTTGRVARPAPPGLNVRALNARAARMLDLSVDEGLLVISVDPRSPAEAAGIEPYDVIVAVDGQRVADSTTASALLRSRRPGDTVTLTVIRDGRQVEVPMMLSGSS